MDEEQREQSQGVSGRAKGALGFANQHRGKLIAAAGALGFLGRRRQKQQAQARRQGLRQRIARRR